MRGVPSGKRNDGTFKVTLDLWVVMLKIKGAVKILLRQSLPERGNHTRTPTGYHAQARASWIRSRRDCTSISARHRRKKIGGTGILDTREVVSVMPIKTWESMGFAGEDQCA